jgi:hypothetical protein
MFDTVVKCDMNENLLDYFIENILNEDIFLIEEIFPLLKLKYEKIIKKSIDNVVLSDFDEKLLSYNDLNIFIRNLKKYKEYKMIEANGKKIKNLEISFNSDKTIMSYCDILKEKIAKEKNFAENFIKTYSNIQEIFKGLNENIMF